MKRIILIIALFLASWSSLCAVAQNKAQQNRIVEVRKLYAKAMENIEADANLPEADNHLIIDLQRMMPGTGIQNKKISYYSREAGDEEQLYKWNVYFMRSTYNVSELKFAEEYLVDENSQQPVFIFYKGNTYEHNGTVEKRFYFNADGTPCFLLITHKDAEGNVISKEEIKNFDEKNDAIEMLSSFQHNMTIYNTIIHHRDSSFDL